MRKFLSKLVSIALATVLVVEHTALAQDLPDFGSRADSALTKTRERILGRSIILQLRNAGVINDDPLLNEYISLLGSQLASQANQGDFEFNFFVIDDATINAFAMPGGVIGIHAGLLLASESENELAGVIAHEVTHVTQRHIARSMAAQRGSSLMTLAASLAAALLSSSSGASPNSTMGAITAVQALAAQRQINFTRAHEYEADRIGMGILADAGFDPSGMASFFEKLSQRESLSPSAIPEMLRTHPTSSGRISEARARARQLPRSDREDSLAYGLAKARLRVLTARTNEEAVAYYRVRADSTNPADRYGRALSLMRVGLSDQAERIFRELREEHPTVIAFRIGRAEALMADGLDEQAMAVYREAVALSPRNIPLVVSYGEALMNAGRPAEAHKILLDLLNNVDPTPKQIDLLARAANAEGDQINAHHYMSELYASVGNVELAITQLRLALDSPGLNNVQRARFTARLGEFQEWLAEAER
jgi:predicted Zn-dependent protease